MFYRPFRRGRVIVSEEKTPWNGDLLSFSEYGRSFTNLVQSIDTTKVISIEGGFGQGKTFFRQCWAQELRAAGEVVIEIDAQQSDHSGDPVITFLGALVAAAPPKEKSQVAALGKKALGVGGMVTRAVLRTVLRNGAEEIIEKVSEVAAGKVQGNEAMEGAVKDLEEGMTKVAGQMIASQLAVEEARQKELPEQIKAIRDLITVGSQVPRIVILIDELDRCQPEYAISLLEAMKLVFGIDGFVFCLLVNPEYLEGIAHHRFGTGASGERYLEKFVDLRLTLRAMPESIGQATETLATKLPLEIPFGDTAPFSVAAAAELAGKLAVQSGLSFRQIKKVLERVELVLRCYRDRPIDLPLMVYLAFAEVAKRPDQTIKFDKGLLPRIALTPEKAKALMGAVDQFRNSPTVDERNHEHYKFVAENCADLQKLPENRYKLAPLTNGRFYHDWAKVLLGLGPHYIPEHREMLAAIHKMTAA
jgi:KAP family P-loop domain